MGRLGQHPAAVSAVSAASVASVVNVAVASEPRPPALRLRLCLPEGGEAQSEQHSHIIDLDIIVIAAVNFTE